MACRAASRALSAVVFVALAPLGLGSGVTLEVLPDGEVVTSERAQALLQKRQQSAGRVMGVEEEEEEKAEEEQKQEEEAGEVVKAGANASAGEEWKECASAAMPLIPEIVVFGANFGTIQARCGGSGASCKKFVESVIGQMLALVHKITSREGLLATCQGEGNTCAHKISDPDGPLAQLRTLVNTTEGAVERCQDKPIGMAMFNCLDVGSLVPTVTAFVQTIVDTIHECKRNCKPVKVLDGCSAFCYANGGNYKCTDRVKYLFGHRSYTLAGAINKVNRECCHACVCSQLDFSDLDDCHKPCRLHGHAVSCQDRVKWVFHHDFKRKGDKQASIDLVNGECRGQCSCSASSKALQRL